MSPNATMPSSRSQPLTSSTSTNTIRPKMNTSRMTPPTSSSSSTQLGSSPSTPSNRRLLPQASPPSTRLRRLAPTPVKIPPTPPYPSSSGRGTTYRQWTAAAASTSAGGSPVKRGAIGRKGSVPSLTLLGGGQMGGDGEEGEEEEEEDLEDCDPFDLEFQFASPPSASPAPFDHFDSEPPSIASITARLPIPIDIPGPSRPSTHRQSSCATDWTVSTQPSFSTSPVYLSHNAKYPNQNQPPLPSSSNTAHKRQPTDRSSLPTSTSRNRTRSSRTIPDVPDEILDESCISSSSFQSRSRNSMAWSGSDEDNARPPTRRTGDELLSPGAFLAAHVPRPVLVQFRDVFGGNDTISPHLPASVFGSPINSPNTQLFDITSKNSMMGITTTTNNTSPGTRSYPTTTTETPRANRSAQFEDSTPIGLGYSPRSPPFRRPLPVDSEGRGGAPMGISPSAISLAGSFATFGVHSSGGEKKEKREREESNQSDVGSFTFSAYHLADDDPVRMGSGIGIGNDEDYLTNYGNDEEIRRRGNLGVDEEIEIGITKGRSGKPISRSTVPHHISNHSLTFGSTTHNEFQPDWINPFAKPSLPPLTTTDSPSFSDDGQAEELVTPEQRDQLLLLSSDPNGSIDLGDNDGDRDLGTPTPTTRVGQQFGLGLGLRLGEKHTSYTQPSSRFSTPLLSPTTQHSTDLPELNLAGKHRVPKMMQEDYNNAARLSKTIRTAEGQTIHPQPQYHVEEPTLPTQTPAPQPKKFKSLASLRKRLPSSRGGGVPPPPPTPALPILLPDSRSGDSIHTASGVNVEYVSLTGKPVPSRPGTASRYPHTSQTIPLPIGKVIGESVGYLEVGNGESPPPTATSLAFSVNSMGTGSTGSTAPTSLIKREDDWRGCLKRDLVLEGVVVPKEMTLNLWVDQENCREVISTLHPIRFHPPTKTRTRALDRIDGILCEKTTFDDLDEVMDDSHDEGDYFWDEGCVEFGMNPRKRAKWTFTYGALEAFPSLRRVTMDGKQNYDFTSRIASLKHRLRGIYAVCGEEKGGAKWRFRYMVDIPIGSDPRARIIVPMSFYVNPAFIRGDHASKLGFSHMIGKALRSNLHSTKMDTPELSSSSTSQSTLPDPTQPISDYFVTRPSTSSFDRTEGLPLAISVQVDKVIDGDMTPRQAPPRQYKPGAAPDRGGDDRVGELSPLIPKDIGGDIGGRRGMGRPSTAQEARKVQTPTQSSSITTSISADLQRIGQHHFNSTQFRSRPGTANSTLPSQISTPHTKNRVAPFLSPIPPTPAVATHSRSTTSTSANSAQAPSSRLSAAFGRARALTTSSRPSTPLSAPLPTVPESSNRPLTSTTSAFANGVMRAKKSLSSLRPPSRPGTAGTISNGNKIIEPPLPTSSSVGSNLGLSSGLGVPGSGSSGRLRTKSNNYVISSVRAGIRPSTAGGSSTGIPIFPRQHQHQNLNVDNQPISSFATSSNNSASKSTGRPSTANPNSQTTYHPSQISHTTPHRPPTAPHTRALAFGFGTYVSTPPSGVTYSALAIQQLEAKRTPGMIRREFYGEEWAGESGGLGMGKEGRSSGNGGNVESRRPRTADPRGKVSMI